ncbi:MAG: tripartite tricarboxylate transporter substrate binding protein, partial [Pigmentiphaga sp.]
RLWARTVFACAFALGMVAAPPAQAAYLDKTFAVIVGFAPGGGNDIVARFISNKLQKRLGATF